MDRKRKIGPEIVYNQQNHTKTNLKTTDMEQEKRIENELQALRNMAQDTGLEVHFKFTEDKRKSVPKYYAETRNTIQVGPVLEYWPMCNFLLGFRKAMQVSGLLPHDPF